MSATMSSNSIGNYLHVAIQIAQECGSLIKTAFMTKAHTISLKEENAADLVTETDKSVETLAFNKLRALFPDHSFVGEETSDGVIVLADEPTWILDPIDGTTNFCHGFPFIAISIGLVIKKVPVVGVIYNPILNHLFYGSQGHGSFLLSPSISPEPLRLPLHASPLPTSLSQALISTEYGSSRDPTHISSKVSTIHHLLKTHVARGIRSIGTAALSMCLVAEGSVDLYYEAGPHIWDFCAGVVIVREAGGLVTSYPSSSSASTSQDIQLLARSVICIRGNKSASATRTEQESSVREQETLLQQFLKVLEPDEYEHDGHQV